MLETISKECIKLELPSHTFPPFSHTNSYLLYDSGQAALVDPGFYDPSSLEKILNALETTKSSLKAILLTHTHLDHQEGIFLLQEHFGPIPVYVHALEQARVKAHNVQVLGSSFSLDSINLQVIFTPGHSPGHVSFYLPEQKIVIVGDVVAGYGSTWIGLPDGNYNDYFSSLVLLNTLKLNTLAPGHGPMIANPYEKLAEVKAHRLKRLEQVLEALDNPLNLTTLRQRIYPDLPIAINTAAEGSLLALLEKLEGEKKIKNIQGLYQKTR